MWSKERFSSIKTTMWSILVKVGPTGFLRHDTLPSVRQGER